MFGAIESEEFVLTSLSSYLEGDEMLLCRLLHRSKKGEESAIPLQRRPNILLLMLT
jgi:hypothetical protein